MSSYLPNDDLGPSGSEPGEFLHGAALADDQARRPMKASDTSHSTPSSGATREYAGMAITVHWDSARCTHSERCTAGAPAVFDRSARPWVQPDAVDADELARVIDTCPSGALSYTRTDGEPNGRRGRAAGDDPAASIAADPPTVPLAASTHEAPVTITPQADGPLVVRGLVHLTQPDGTVEVRQGLALCRCGQSGARPLCDGTHARVGFTAPGVA